MQQQKNKKMIRFYKQFAKTIKYLLMVLVTCVCGLLYSCKNQEITAYGVNEDKVEDTTKNQTTQIQKGVFVYVCGCVNNPGVYEVSKGTRVYELVKLSGGMTEDANEQAISMASQVTDGQTLYIPSKDENVNVSNFPNASGKVNINSANKEQLMGLTGIGESRAQDIINYREQNGPFEKIEDIMKVSGIKDAAFSKIKNEISVN